MKNNFLLKISLIFFLLYTHISVSDEFDLKSENLNILENGDVIELNGNVEVNSLDGLIIYGDKSTLNKKINSLIVNGNVKLVDENRNIIINSNYLKYDKDKELIFSKGKTNVELDNGYTISSENIFFDRQNMIVYSDFKTFLEKKDKNYFEFKNFKYNLVSKIANVTNLLMLDKNENKFIIDNATLDINKEEIFGNDGKLFFEKSSFGNVENDPRLLGETLKENPENTIIKNGFFTTCKFREGDKCPPWIIKADEVKHNKKEKKIEYKNAWLNIYDFPVMYFPKFHHPDPTVDRQSGFLIPRLNSSNVFGSSIQIPYYKVLSDNKDYTISPRLFFDDKLMFQTEFRQANEKSDIIFDHGFLREDQSTNSYFFSNYKKVMDNETLSFNLETVSNKNYLKKYDVNSQLVHDNSTLNSYLSYEKNFNNQYFYTSIESFEDLTVNDSDSYEYVFPRYLYRKDMYHSDGYINLQSKGFQKKYKTNKYDGMIINDLNFTSYEKLFKNKTLNNFTINLKNVNSDGSKSENLKEGADNKLLAQYIFNSRLPMKKKSKNFDSYLTPKFSFRFSPTETKNIKSNDLRVGYANIFSDNRLGIDDALEGGESITISTDYSIRDNNDYEKLNFSIGQIFRLNENDDLPEVSSIGNKRSDLIGKFKFFPNDIMNFNYSFSADKDLKDVNYNFIETSVSYKNLFSSFEIFNSSNIIEDKSYISNKTNYRFNKNNSVGFATNKNLEKDLTEYYDLIYQYENDCLVAALEYKKTYYSDVDLSPEENIFLTIKIVPFGKINTPKVN
ncbi:MAG: hypothetical protein CMI86_01400 [Candidatus Pelagibacter sp.]|nr:hypothetical protein [Candidatus Pelagibacter sp.]